MGIFGKNSKETTISSLSMDSRPKDPNGNEIADVRKQNKKLTCSSNEIAFFCARKISGSLRKELYEDETVLGVILEGTLKLRPALLNAEEFKIRDPVTHIRSRIMLPP